MTATSLPPTETRVTQAYFIREKIEDELAKIQDGTKTKDPLPAAVHSLDASWRTANPQQGLSALLHLMTFTSTDSSKTSSTDIVSRIVSRIGFLNRHGINAPLNLYIQGDIRNHSTCKIVIEEGSPNIGIPEYWLLPKYRAHRKHYRIFVETLATRLGMPEITHGFIAEREFVKALPPAQKSRDGTPFTWSTLHSTFRHIDWTALLTAWGLDATILPHAHFTLTSPAFIHQLQSRLTSGEWSWRGWLALLVAQWYSGCSPPGPLRNAWFAYNRRFLQGLAVDEAGDVIRRAAVRSLLPNTVGRVWISWLRREREGDALRTHVVALVESIRRAAIHALQGATWMSPSTRAAATQKLRALAIEVGWPTGSWMDEEVSLSPTNLIENMLSIGAASTRANQRLLASGTCRAPQTQAKRWNNPVFEVNAFYYPEENRFILPAAILRPPFYELRRPDAWNYGAIGATIGHELCHAFDSEGRQYDARGDKRDWWTPRDDKGFRQKTRRVTRLYETRKYRGLPVDGELTLVENIADIGGLEFALVALRERCAQQKVPVTPAVLRLFFTSFAVSWRAKDRIRRAAELLDVDPHAPPLLRVNHVVRQMDAWYEAFGVGPECAEYIAPERRIRFWG